MIPTKDNAVQVDFDNAQARLKVRNMDVFDDHDLANSLTQGLGLPATVVPPNGIPPIFPVRAKDSFDIVWNGAIDTAQITNTSEQFKGTFFASQTTIKWSSEQEGFFVRVGTAQPGAKFAFCSWTRTKWSVFHVIQSSRRSRRTRCGCVGVG